MKIDIPAFKFVDGDTTIASFETYDQLYEYCRGNENMMGVIMASAEIVMLFGEVPLKYDVATNRLYSLGWREVGKPHKRKGRSQMTKPLITLPCTAQELENALHAACDYDGLWGAKIYYGISGQGLDAVPVLRIVIEGEKGETK